MTARRKTRFVVRKGRMGVRGEEGLVGSEGREREKRRGVGAKRERVPVPVLYFGGEPCQLCGSGRGGVGVVDLSGRCSPCARISRMRLRY